MRTILAILLTTALYGCNKSSPSGAASAAPAKPDNGALDVKFREAEFAGKYENAIADAPPNSVTFVWVYRGCEITCDKARDENHALTPESVQKACAGGAVMSLSFAPGEKLVKSSVNINKGDKVAPIYADRQLDSVSSDTVQVTLSKSSQASAADSPDTVTGTIKAKICPPPPN